MLFKFLEDLVRRCAPEGPPVPGPRPMIVMHPGAVVSRTDGDVHYLTFGQLCQSYGLNPGVVLNACHPAHAAIIRHERERGVEVIDLFPRADGGYDGARRVLGLDR